MVSSLETIEVGTPGVFDDTLFGDGKPCSSLIESKISKSANYVSIKAEHLHSLSWSTRYNAASGSQDIGAHRSHGFVSGWFRLTPSFRQMKHPRATMATCKINASIKYVTGVEAVWFAVTTRASPVIGKHKVKITATSGSPFITGTIDDVPLIPEESERITYWAKGVPTDATQTGGGTPTNFLAWQTQAGQFRCPAGSSPAWTTNATAGSNWSDLGTYLEVMSVVDGKRLLPYLFDVIGVSNGDLLDVTPVVDLGWLRLAVGHEVYVRRLPTFILGSLSMVAKQRTF